MTTRFETQQYVNKSVETLFILKGLRGLPHLGLFKTHTCDIKVFISSYCRFMSAIVTFQDITVQMLFNQNFKLIIDCRAI